MTIDALIDDDGAVVVVTGGHCKHCGAPVEGHRVPGTSLEFDRLSRRAATAAAALGGVPPIPRVLALPAPGGPDYTVPEHDPDTSYPTFRRVLPVRMAAETGIPRDLVHDPELAPGPKFIYMSLFGEAALTAVIPRTRGFLRVWARAFGIVTATMATWLEALVRAGWAFVRKAPHGSKGEVEVTLFFHKTPACIDVTEPDPLIRPVRALPKLPPSPRKAERQEVGRAVRRAREGAGLKQRELADAIGVAKPTVSRWESGTLGISSANLGKIRRMLGVRVALLPEHADEGPER